MLSKQKLIVIGVVAFLLIVVIDQMRRNSWQEESHDDGEAGKELTQAAKGRDWKEFHAPDGKFQVQLPTMPQHASESAKKQKTKKTTHSTLTLALKRKTRKNNHQDPKIVKQKNASNTTTCQMKQD